MVAQINIVTVSTINPQACDPIDQYASTGKWASRDESEKFYHTHPEIYDFDTVREVMAERFTDGLNIIDLCPDTEDPEENVEEPEEIQQMNPDRKKSILERIKHSNLELAIEASADGRLDRRTGDEYQRTVKFGNERYTNLLLSDHKEFHRDPW